MPSASHSPVRQRRKQARPQELLNAALELFVEKGFSATRSDDVAARAGVSKGTLYLYFPSKEDLFRAVVRENLLPVLDEAEQAIDTYEGHSAELMREFILGWWERIGDTPLSGLTKLMMAESGNFPEVAKFYHDEIISRSDALVIRMLERGMARGDFLAARGAEALLDEQLERGVQQLLRARLLAALPGQDRGGDEDLRSHK